VANENKGLLHGLKVLDLTEHMAGPFCTLILADMGAGGVKLERPGKGDSVRAWGDRSERNAYFRYINRNKKGVTLDYKQPRGQGAVPEASRPASTCWSRITGRPSCRAPAWAISSCARSIRC